MGDFFFLKKGSVLIHQASTSLLFTCCMKGLDVKVISVVEDWLRKQVASSVCVKREEPLFLGKQCKREDRGLEGRGIGHCEADSYSEMLASLMVQETCLPLIVKSSV